MTMLSMPYHAGFVVADVREGIRDFEERLGYTFNEPISARAEDMEDRISGTRGPIDLWISYTRESPFRLEVIQTSGEGVYGPKYLGLHHLGIWEPDPEARLHALKKAGDPVDAIFRDADGSVSIIYARSATIPGCRIEYVGDGARPVLEHWFETGSFA